MAWIETLRSDVRSNLRSIEMHATNRRMVTSLLWSPGVQSVTIYRISRTAYLRGGRVWAEIFKRLNHLLYGVQIDYAAEIGPGLAIKHPGNLVIGDGVVIGRNVTIFNGVNLGNRRTESEGRPDGFPRIEDGVVICTGAKVLGPITVGRDSVVGANTVLTFSVPNTSRVVGGKAHLLTDFDPLPTRHSGVYHNQITNGGPVTAATTASGRLQKPHFVTLTPQESSSGQFSLPFPSAGMRVLVSIDRWS